MSDTNPKPKQVLRELIEAIRPEPYQGRTYKLACPGCGGSGERNGVNSDDPKWVPCWDCDGSGLRPALREVVEKAKKIVGP